MRCVAIRVGAEAAQQARAAIGRRAAADPEDDRARPRVDGGPEGLARPNRRGGHRIALCGRDARQAGRLGHLDHRPVAGGRAQPARPDRSPERVMDLGNLPLPATGRGDRLERSLATVGERAEEGRVGGAGPVPAVRQRPRDLDRCQRALERIRGEQDRPRAARDGAHRRSFQKHVADRSPPSGSIAKFGIGPASCQPSER